MMLLDFVLKPDWTGKPSPYRKPSPRRVGIAHHLQRASLGTQVKLDWETQPLQILNW